MSNISEIVKSLESVILLPQRLAEDQNDEFSFISKVQDLKIPDSATDNNKDSKVIYDITSDASVLTCGCIVSESLALSLSQRQILQCPVCSQSDVKILNSIMPLRDLYTQIQQLKEMAVEKPSKPEKASTPMSTTFQPEKEKLSVATSGIGNFQKYGNTYTDSYLYSRSSPRNMRSKNKVSLVELFQMTAMKIKDDDEEPQSAVGLSEQYDLFTGKDSSLESTSAKSVKSSSAVKFSPQPSSAISISVPGTGAMSESASIPQPILGKKSTRGSFSSQNDTLSEDASVSSSPRTSRFGIMSQMSLTRTRSQTSDKQHLPSSLTVTSNSDLFSNASTVNSAGNSAGFALDPKEDFDREYRYANNFPVYRKRIQHSTQTSKMKSILKRTDFIGTSISPDATKFALVEDKRWFVYSISADSSMPPTLLCCGRSNGHYGPNMENLKKLNQKFYTEEKNRLVFGDESTSEYLQSGDWSFEYCALSDTVLVIAGKKILRVFDITRDGKPVYTHNVGFPIRCIDISNMGRFIACGLTGKDKVTDSEGSLIMLYELFYEEPEYGQYSQPQTASAPLYNNEMPPRLLSKSLINAKSQLVALQYKDPINIVKFSRDSSFLGVSTALESRFMVINIQKPSDPRLVMKASRKLDTSYESEGITDLCFFGDNNKYLTVSSVAFNAPTLIVETRITNLKESQSVAHPRMLMKIEEIGSSIHKCCVSPRNDAFAFINKKGNVFIMHVNSNFERKRIVIAGDVMCGTKKSEAASLRFSRNGYKLYVVDRKGVLYIEDFIAGTPQSHDVTKCKPVV